MRWNKFQALIQQHSWLRGHVGSPHVIDAPLNHSTDKATRLLKDWVRQKVGFIAFRPFESLDLHSRNWILKHTLSPVVWPHCWEGSQWDHTTYCIVFHIEGEQPFVTRRQWVEIESALGKDKTTIRNVIGDLVNWHQQCWGHQGKALCLDAVVKTMSRGSSLAGCTSQSLEIYPFPPGFNPQTV